MTATIVMQWPVPQVWPNYRQSHHWRSYCRQVKAQRGDALILARAAGIRAREHDGSTIAMTVTINPPDRRRRDRDGMTGACKSILDGIADAMGVDDQYFRPEYVIGDVVERGRIIVEVGAL